MVESNSWLPVRIGFLPFDLPAVLILSLSKLFLMVVEGGEGLFVVLLFLGSKGGNLLVSVSFSVPLSSSRSLSSGLFKVSD